MAKIPAPTNRAIEVTKIVLDKLIEGAGVEIAVTTAQSYLPFLAAPVVRNIFRYLVELLADSLNDDLLFPWAVKIVLKLQSSPRKSEYNAALQPIIRGTATDEEIQRAKDAADAIINRNR